MHLADAFIQSDLQCIQAIHVLLLISEWNGFYTNLKLVWCVTDDFYIVSDLSRPDLWGCNPDSNSSANETERALTNESEQTSRRGV